MDIDLIAPGFERLVDRDPPLDRIAYGLTFGEGPVWDKRTKQLYWVDIIGNTIWKWKPGVGREVVLKPSGHANGMTFVVRYEALWLCFSVRSKVVSPAESNGLVPEFGLDVEGARRVSG